MEILHIRYFLSLTGQFRGSGLRPLLVRSAAASAIVRFTAVLASFLVGLELARTLGPQGYGYYGMALAIVTIAALPGEMGIPRLVVRDVSVAAAQKDYKLLFGVLRWANRTAARISCLIAIALLGAAYLLSTMHSSPLWHAIMVGAPIVPLLTLARIRGSALQGLHHIVRGQIPDVLLRPLLTCVLVVAVVSSPIRLTPPLAMALNSIVALGVFLVAATWLRRELPQAPAVLASHGRRWLASSIPMGLTDAMRSFHAELSVLLLGFILTPAQAGLFRIANISSITASTPVAVLTYVAFPVIARLYAEGDRRRLQQILTKLAQAQFAAVVALCLPLLLFPGELLALVFGAKYVPAANALRILAAAQIATSALGLTYSLLNMTHQERRVTRATAIGLIANIIGVAVLSRLWGLTGAAVAVALTFVLSNALVWRDARRLLGFETSIFPRPAVRYPPSFAASGFDRAEDADDQQGGGS